MYPHCRLLLLVITYSNIAERKKLQKNQPMLRILNIFISISYNLEPLPSILFPETKISPNVQDHLEFNNKIVSETQSKPIVPIVPETVMWNSTNSPIQLCSPYYDSPFIRNRFFAPPQQDLSLSSPRGVTAFTPYRFRPSMNPNVISTFNSNFK